MPDKKDWYFRMCKYCGGRITEGVNKWGRPDTAGVYCSAACADAVHGFDRQIESERRNKVVSFNASVHDRACTQTRTPAEIMMEAEEGEQGGTGGSGVMAAIEKARKIDKRLPDILMGIANGETQEQAAKRWGISQVAVHQLIKRLRASI